MSKVPDPGIYPRIPFEEYASWPFMNMSTLSQGVLWDGTVSMKHLRAFLDGKIPRPVSKDLTLGSAIHTRLLEPEAFDARHPVKGQCAAVVQSGKNKGQTCRNAGLTRTADGNWWCGVHPQAEAIEVEGSITAEECQRCHDLARSIQDHDAIRLFKAQGGVEVSFVVDWEVTYFLDGKEKMMPLRMKGRLDKDISAPKGIPPTIVDVKKVQVGSHTDKSVASAIEKWHYDMKAAFYLDGMEKLDGVRREFVWAVVEDDWPFDVNCVHADPETLDIGRIKYRELLAQYAAAFETNRWPGIHADVHRGGLSGWAKKQYEGTNGPRA